MDSEPRLTLSLSLTHTHTHISFLQTPTSINNDDRPDEAFTTERAVRAGRANAASGERHEARHPMGARRAARGCCQALHVPAVQRGLVLAAKPPRATGRIMVNVPNDHFGPIPPEADPRGTGIKVGIKAANHVFA